MTTSERPSVLSAPSALLLSGLITVSYVGGLYIARSARLSFSKTPQDVGDRGQRARQANEKWRDDDDVIRARLQAACLSTCMSCGVVYACVLLGNDNDGTWTTAVVSSLRLLGIRSPSLSLKALLPHILTPLLYTGPLTAQLLSETLPLQRHWSYQANLQPIFATWMGLRNFVVAPITEELVFRACLLAIAELSGKGTYGKIFITPLWFGIAHLHHAYELYNRFGRTRPALMRALMTCLVQLTYTTLFGAYTSFLLVRTGSILPPITAHVVANIMGLPQLGWDLGQHPNQRLLIYAAYISGVVGFVSMLDSWTA